MKRSLKHFDEQLLTVINRPYVQPLTQVNAGDIIEIAVNFFSLQGLVDIDTIEWQEPELTITPKENVLTYDNNTKKQNSHTSQKIFCDLARICEVEDQVIEWYDSRYF